MDDVGATTRVASEGSVGGLPNAMPAVVWLSYERATDRVLVTAWPETGTHHHFIRSARRGTPTTMRRTAMFVIGIDPHRGSHAAAVLDEQEHLRAVMHGRPTTSNDSAC
jgi:hypothetical protein